MLVSFPHSLAFAHSSTLFWSYFQALTSHNKRVITPLVQSITLFIDPVMYISKPMLCVHVVV